MKKLAFLFLLLSVFHAHSQNTFPIDAASIYVDSNDHWLVNKAATLFQKDIQSITGRQIPLLHQLPKTGISHLIIIGSLDRCPLVQTLAKEHRFPAEKIKGHWESFLQKTISHPLPGVQDALLITGSDKRGTAYGIFDLSKTLGVSPWYWWADVPIPKKDHIDIPDMEKMISSPAVRYRGFFINDEAPALSGWVHATYGNYNHLFYEKVFELLLRLKANYLWPAMWGNAFNDDDTLNPILADRYGIVMGTSHHEPMLRAQQEWKRYGQGAWDYSSNAAVLDSFWQKGIEHMDHHESIVTVGMRGDGDKPMEENANIALLEKIVHDQRAILQKVTGKTPAEIPQSWALYKEVQDYYDKGMRVPDDITLLLCDDNWGNVRKLPLPGEKPRPGGYGLYYHFDYVGGPRNYKWINTNPIPRIWEQLHLTWTHGVDRIWIVNIGDIKPLELPTEFFLDYAWAPSELPAEKLSDWLLAWTTRQFGPAHAAPIADILRLYTKYNGRRKPELLSPDTYSLFNYKEAENIVADYRRLAERADSIDALLPAACHDAYYELVLYPVEAGANLNELYFTIAKNRYYASRGLAAANDLAAKARTLFEKDSLLSHYYNTTLAGGKWPHMMDQTHIGYTGWQEPRYNTMPEVRTIYLPSGNLPDHDIATADTDQYKHPDAHIPPGAKGFAETDGYISMEADHYTRRLETAAATWMRIPDLGRTGSAMEAMPVTGPSATPGPGSPRLEYDVYLSDTGSLNIQAYFSPIISFNRKPICYAISFDDEQPQIIDISSGNEARGVWDKMVTDNIRIAISRHRITRPGKHILKYWLIDHGPVLQKLIIDAGGLKPSYLGPPESPRAY